MKIILITVASLLFITTSFAQKKCCTNKETVKKGCKIDIAGCDTCCTYDKHALLIYDAKCKKYFFRNRCGKAIAPLNSTKQLHLKNKQAFTFKIININRYMNDVVLTTSDIALSSSQPPIMRQYLFPGSSTDEVPQPPTGDSNSSKHQGVQVFDLISSFKSRLIEMEMLQNTIQNNYSRESLKGAVNLVENSNNIIYKTYLEDFRKTHKTSEFAAIDSLKPIYYKIKSAIDSIRYIKDYEVALNAYLHVYMELHKQYDTMIYETIKTIKEYSERKNKLFFTNSKKNKYTANTIREVFLDVKKQKINFERKLKYYQNVYLTSKKLDTSFRHLEEYYIRTIQEKIDAYSLCTDSFKCCKDLDTTLTYKHFNSLISKITKSYLEVRTAFYSFPDTIPTSKPTVNSIKSKINKSNAGKSSIANTEVFKIAGTNLEFDKKGTVKGIKLQLDQAAQPKKKTSTATDNDPNKQVKKVLDSLGKSWRSFEKSIPPKYVMRQILFRKNRIAEKMGYTSPPIYPYGDRLQLTLKISTTDTAKKHGLNHDEVFVKPLDFIVRGKTLFSFSAGSFLGFSDGFRTPRYEFKQVPVLGSNTVQPNSPYRLESNGNSSLPIGAVALANVTTNICDGFWLGGSIGVGVVADPNVRVGYTAGATVSFGTYHQFHFTGGALFMNVNRLKDSYRNNSDLIYETKPTDDIYEQENKMGGFVAFSYTVFKLKSSRKRAITDSTETK